MTVGQVTWCSHREGFSQNLWGQNWSRGSSLLPTNVRGGGLLISGVSATHVQPFLPPPVESVSHYNLFTVC